MATVAKKAPGKKPAKKTTPPRAPRTPGGEAKPAPPVVTPKSIVVEGREVAIKLPTAEQLMAWQETLSAIAGMKADLAEFEKLRTHLDRFYRIAARLFVHDEDREWLEEGRLDGIISIEKDSVMGMITNVIEVYREELEGRKGDREAAILEAGNRAEKRAAARKKA